MSKIACNKCGQKLKYTGYQLDSLEPKENYTASYIRNIRDLCYCKKCEIFVEGEYKKSYYCELRKEFVAIQ